MSAGRYAKELMHGRRDGALELMVSGAEVSNADSDQGKHAADINGKHDQRASEGASDKRGTTTDRPTGRPH